MRKLLQRVIKILTKRILTKYNPIVVGITGSVGKTGTKEAIYSALYRSYSVRKNTANDNNEIGVPLAVLGIEPSGSRERPATLASRWRLIKGIFVNLWLAYGFVKGKFPKILILELGADRPGDIAYLSEIVRPSIAVISAIGDVPVHIEHYPTPESVAEEKSHILDYLGTEGVAVLNADDPIVASMGKNLECKVMTFGLTSKANVWASDISYYTGSGTDKIEGISCSVHFGKSSVPIRINGLIAAHQLYAILAGITIGVQFGLSLAEVATSLENHEQQKHRMYLMDGMKESIVIDDTYNASPLSMRASIDALKDFGTASKARKIAVLGDMKELGDYSKDAHTKIGEYVIDKADYLVTVGDLAIEIANTAKSKMPEDHVLSFSSADLTIPKIKEIIMENDVILVKGSRAMKMEIIVEGIKR